MPSRTRMGEHYLIRIILEGDLLPFIIARLEAGIPRNEERREMTESFASPRLGSDLTVIIKESSPVLTTSSFLEDVLTFTFTKDISYRPLR